MANANDRHAEGFKQFEGLGDVEQGLDASGNNHHRGFGQLLQIGGNVETVSSAPAMDAAHAAGGKGFDARLCGANHRGGDGGRAALACNQGIGEVGTGQFDECHRAGRDCFDLLGWDRPTFDHPVKDGDGLRDRHLLCPDDLFDFKGGADIFSG